MGVSIAAPPTSLVWHDLECGAYRADLALWHELAALAADCEPRAPVLDIGAGSGRVALELARAGHDVTAVDLDAELLAALRERATAPAPQTICADARRLALPRRDHALCLVPMQTLQLMGGERGRSELLHSVRSHLRRGGVLACAIVTQLEEFDCTGQELGPQPERARIDGVTYISRAVRVAIGRRTIRIDRERRVLAPAGETRERNVIELDRVSAAHLVREGRAAGLQAAGVRTIAATAEHVGSEVVLLRG